MSQMNERASKAAQELAAKIERARAQMKQEGLWVDEPLKEPEYQCEVCQDRGQVRAAVPWGDPLFGKMLICPNPKCKTAANNRARVFGQRAAKSLADYARFTFQTWDDNVDDRHFMGKRGAYYALRLFASESGHWVSSSDVNRLAGQPPPDTERVNNWIVLEGKVGVGKTGLVAATVNELQAVGVFPVFMRAREIIDSIQERYGVVDPPRPNELKRQYTTAGVLCIDEMTIENPTPDRVEMIEEIVRGRYANGLPMIMTTNLSQDLFTRQWGRRTADVIFERAHWYTVDGLPLRQPNKPVTF